MTWPIPILWPYSVRHPLPASGPASMLPQIRAALKRGGRRRNIDAVAHRIQTGLRARHLSAPEPVADAYGTTVGALVKLIAETNRQITDLDTALGNRFRKHPDADIYLSMPGLGTVLGARALGEFEVRPRTLHQRQVTQELRRHVTHHRRVRPQTHRGRPTHTQQATLRRPRPMGVHFPTKQSRRQRVLLPTESSRRRTPPSPPSPSQPTRRHPPRLPQTPNPL